MRRRWLAFCTGLLAAAGLAAGCGGGGGGSTAAPAVSTPPPQAATTAAAAAGSGSGTAGGTLDGVVGPGFTITLTQNGQPVSTLAAGSYTIVVDDKADIHNFHLTGPGVDEATDVSGTGKETWKVDLKPGTYHFQCDPHASSMNGDFTVS